MKLTHCCSVSVTLDQAAKAQLANGGPLGGLLVGEVADGVTEEVAPFP